MAKDATSVGCIAEGDVHVDEVERFVDDASDGVAILADRLFLAAAIINASVS